MAHEDLMVTKIGYQQLDFTLACSWLQDQWESKSKHKHKKPREDWGERVSGGFARLHILGDPGVVRSGEKAGRKFSSTGKRAPGYRLSVNYFQKFKQIPAPDWA